MPRRYPSSDRESIDRRSPWRPHACSDRRIRHALDHRHAQGQHRHPWHTNVYVIDSQGRVLFCRNPAQSFDAPLGESQRAMWEAAAKLPPGKLAPKTPSGDRRYYVSTANVPRVPGGLGDWQLFASRSYEDTVAQTTDGKGRGIAVLLTLLGVAAVIAIWLSRSISKPIDELTQSAALAAGDYSSRARRARGAEINRLADSFNHMADAVAREKQTLEVEIVERHYVEIRRRAHHNRISRCRDAERHGATIGRCRRISQHRRA